MDSPFSQADATSACLLDSCHTNRHTRRAQHLQSPHPGFMFHRTCILLCVQSFRTPSVRSFILLLDPRLLHRLTRSVYVHNPPRLAPAKQARIQPHFPFIFPFTCIRLKPFLHPLRIPQPCCWSCECPSRSAFAFSFVSSRLIQHRTSGSRGAISWHTYTHSLSFAPSLSPRECGPASDLTFPRTH